MAEAMALPAPVAIDGEVITAAEGEVLDKLEAAERALDQIEARDNFEAWLLIGDVLDEAHRASEVKAGKARGGAFNGYMGIWLSEHPRFGKIHAATRCDALWMFQNRDKVSAWRAEQEDTLTLNHPTTIRHKYQREIYLCNPKMRRIGQAKYERYVAAIERALSTSKDARKIALAGLRALDINPPPSARGSSGSAGRRRNSRSKQHSEQQQHVYA
jgi:hypothetical protein